jgi:CheY-like chemotaxis protein
VCRSREKGLAVTTAIAPGTAPTIVGDPTRLKQVITNLVANAIKFTAAGGIHASVRQLHEASTRHLAMLQFSVRDTGIGVPPDMHAAIFEAFRQADTSVTRRFGGTGLGLAIASKLVAMMGGEIWLGSAPGAGSTFHFTGRFALGQVKQAPDPAALPPAVRSLRVLVADDNVVNQRVAVGLLTRRGHHVTAVATGREALQALEQRPFDAVLMDLHMPDLDGVEATQHIRRIEEETGGHVRVIALTADAISGIHERCVAAGMDDYVIKPFTPSDLFAVLERSESV